MDGDVELKELFSSYLERKRVFDKSFFDNLEKFSSKTLFRKKESMEIAQHLAPVLNGIFLQPIFIFGSEGAGKSQLLFDIYRNFSEVVEEKNLDIATVFVQCSNNSLADTPYRFFSFISNRLGVPTPHTGLSLKRVMENFKHAVAEYSGVVLFVDDFGKIARRLQNNFEVFQIKNLFLVVTSRTPADFKESWSHIKKLFRPKEIYLQPYSSSQVYEILKIKLGNYVQNFEETALQFIAAYAARNGGNVSLAISILKTAAFLAEKTASVPVSLDIVRRAVSEFFTERITSLVQSLSVQHKFALRAVLSSQNQPVKLSDAYKQYTNIASEFGIKAVGYRRFFDIITELESLGILSLSVISLGRHGRVTMITPTENVKTAVFSSPEILEV